jgi:hypothetical protein
MHWDTFDRLSIQAERLAMIAMEPTLLWLGNKRDLWFSFFGKTGVVDRPWASDHQQQIRQRGGDQQATDDGKVGLVGLLRIAGCFMRRPARKSNAPDRRGQRSEVMAARRTFKIELHDKVAALRLLAQHYGVFG